MSSEPKQQIVFLMAVQCCLAAPTPCLSTALQSHDHFQIYELIPQTELAMRGSYGLGKGALKGYQGHSSLIPQTCFSMRGSDCRMVENRVIFADLGARLRAQFFQAF